ncbi:MAG: LapA family protein [Alphaproteobacteria bacterium]|nr:LapA family protein [Alphaproteobacteria bacterium]
MRLVKSAVPVITIVLVIDVIASNIEPVGIGLWPLSNQMYVPLGILLLISFSVAFMLGMAYDSWLKHRKIKELNKENKKLLSLIKEEK